MADGITRIAVEGFKSISKRQSIDIAPLTILAGANSSGKSSIMQPLLMLKQTLGSYLGTPALLLLIGGPVTSSSPRQRISFLSRNRWASKGLVKRLLRIEVATLKNAGVPRHLLQKGPMGTRCNYSGA